MRMIFELPYSFLLAKKKEKHTWKKSLGSIILFRDDFMCFERKYLRGEMRK